jgi:hypothetical protein
VNDLVDHNLTKLELLMLLTNVLRDHSNSLAIFVEAVAVAIGVFIIAVQSTNSRGFTYATVTLGASTAVLPSKIERLEEEEDGNLDESQEQENDLDNRLSSVKLFALRNSSRLEEHVNKHVEQSRRLAASAQPINRPFVNNANNKVAKDGLEEDHARDEVTPDVNGLLEVASIDVREAERVGHVCPAQKDTHLHLQTVAEEEVILTSVPCIIQTEGVTVTIFP